MRGAHFFDIDEICNKDLAPLPHMVAPLAAFRAYLGRLGARRNSQFLLYDSSGAFCASARVWWNLRYYGVTNVRVLHGDYREFRSAAPELCNAETPAMPAENTEAELSDLSAHPSLLCVSGELLSLYGRYRDTSSGAVHLPSSVLILDARERERYLSEMGEPRAVKRLGHLPAAQSLWHADIHTVKRNGKQRFIHVTEMRALFESRGVDFAAAAAGKQRIITYCGSGVTAATLSLGLFLCGVPASAVGCYDGSFAEYANSADWPLELEKLAPTTTPQ
jgi:thiosulfate/3-mercaptopyruvate sulfurtransferase